MTDQAKQSANKGHFRPGHARLGGRPKGGKNKTTLDIRAAMLEAAAELGADGKGKDGMKGFFKATGVKKPELLAGWIADLVPRDEKPNTNGNAEHAVMTINIIGVESGTFLSAEEAKRSRYGELPLLEHEPGTDDDDEPPPGAA